ncbi:MAG: DegV family protein [Lachnospiraceae bacterium]|nr:DegV family protein [Lachnospiraceae bacterium]
MNDYVITTDNCADLPDEFFPQNGVGLICLTCMMDGQDYNADHPISGPDFFNRLREGATPTTSQITPDQAKSFFEGYLKEGKDVVHVAFASGMSGSCGTAMMAAEELNQKYPDHKVIVIDSLRAALGQGLLVERMVKMKAEGAPIDEVAAWCEKARHQVVSYILLEDMSLLYRGGRLSKDNAVPGSMVGIKPLILIGDDGKLQVVGKIRGHKKAVQTILASLMEKLGEGEKTVTISHGDCAEAAEAVKKQLIEDYGMENVEIGYLGVITGTHTGPGTLLISAMGNENWYVQS